MLQTASDKELMKLTKEQLIATIRFRDDVIARLVRSRDCNKSIEYQNDFNIDIIRSLLKSVENLSQNKGGE